MFCTFLETVFDVTSISRIVVAEEVIFFVESFVNIISNYVGSNDVRVRLANAIETNFTYFFSTTDFNTAFFSFDPEISQAFTDEGYEVLLFESRLEMFLIPGSPLKGATCLWDYVECTLNQGVVSIIKTKPGNVDEEVMKVLRTAKTYMDTRGNDDINLLSYRSPELPELGVPSSIPTGSPFATLSPTQHPTAAPTILFKNDVTFTYALEYQYNGSPPEILAGLISAVESQIVQTVAKEGYNSKILSSSPKKRDQPGMCAPFF